MLSQTGRAAEAKVARRDRHNPAIWREHKKLFRGFTSAMVGLSDLRVLRGDVIIIRGIIGPYLAPISKFLTATPVPGEVEDDVKR